MCPTPRKDLIVLVADANAKFAMLGLLSRSRSLRIREPSADIYVHPEKDPGCCLRSHEVLRSFAEAYSHALVMFDREGCGRDEETRERLEAQVSDRLSRSGWADRSEVVVLDPEIDIWVWSASPHVPSVLGWTETGRSLNGWLVREGFLARGQTKPSRPKEALEKAMSEVRKPRSSSLYRQLAEKVSLGRCEDPAFLKLRSTLRRWFPASENVGPATAP